LTTFLVVKRIDFAGPAIEPDEPLQPEHPCSILVLLHKEPQMTISAQTKAVCGSCNKSVPELDLSTCGVCDAKFCGSCSQCDCDRIKEVFEDLTAVANRSAMHASKSMRRIGVRH
jgi:hypothetical protein